MFKTASAAVAGQATATRRHAIVGMAARNTLGIRMFKPVDRPWARSGQARAPARAGRVPWLWLLHRIGLMHALGFMHRRRRVHRFQRHFALATIAAPPAFRA